METKIMKTKITLGEYVNGKYDIMTSIRKLTYKSLVDLVDKSVYDSVWGSIRTPVRNSLWGSVYRSVDESIRRV